MDIISLEYIVGTIVGVLSLIQLCYVFVIYNAPNRYCITRRKETLRTATHQPGMSVVITAADQEALLERHLPHILEQDYPDYEVIVVDDNSMDDTKDLLERLTQRYPQLYMTHTSDSIRYISHKKLALTLGIKAAKKEWVVFIEPDCYPTSNQWLSHLATRCTDDVDVVLGYSNYERKPGFANACYIYDTLVQQLRMLGLTLRGKGYMGIGRNMAYRRDIFFTHKGYSHHLDLERGEDDLFINEHVPSKRIAAHISDVSIVRCVSTSYHAWKNEKLTRLYIRNKMRGVAPYILATDTLTRILSYVAVVAAITLGSIVHTWWLVVWSSALWLTVLASRIYVFHSTARKLDERRYHASLLLFDIIRPAWELFFRIRLRVMPKDMHLRRKV